MPLVRILEDYNAAEGHQVGDVVDITDPAALIAEGKVELVDEATPITVAPVEAEPIVEEEVIEAPVEEEVEIAPESVVEQEVAEEPQVEAAVEGAETE